MASLREYKARVLLPFVAVGLVAYCVLVFIPLGRKSQSLDGPLQKAWQRLALSMEQTNLSMIDFLHITNQLSETRQALAILESAKQKAAARIEIGAAVRAKMHAPFQLVEYESERSKQVEELNKLAKEKQVTIEPGVTSGYPEYTADARQPELLWAALSLIDNVLRTAVQCKVQAIHSLEVPLVLTNTPSSGSVDRLAEIPIQVELTAPADSAAKLLQSLPLRADELRAANLPEAPPDKPALFIDRLIIRKQSPEKTDEVRVAIRVVGFVLRD